MTVTKESLREARAHSRQLSESKGFVIAAGFVERLLPEKCGDVWHDPDWNDRARLAGFAVCPACLTVDGQLWDEGLVAVVADALKDPKLATRREYARAVLSALIQEVGR